MTQKTFTAHHGRLVARALEGAWRQDPPPLGLAKEELDEIAPILLKSGAAALVWWRLNRTNESQSYPEFFEAYRQQTLEAAVHEDDVAQVFRVLQEARLDALVVKGWAIAHRYPDPGLRHYSDLDLCVRNEHFQRVSDLVRQSLSKEIWIDLHEGTGALDYATEAEIFDRSIVVPLDEGSARIPCHEDHLRMLCLHLLRHGAWRPLWLCDVALALETRAANFDWQLFLGDDLKRADWLGCVLGLAHRLLGARVSDTPVAERAATLPNWLLRAVTRRWGRWFNSDYRNTAIPSLWSNKWKPMRVVEDIYFRCDPIRATVEMKGSFNRGPRLPYQIAAFLWRAPEITTRVIKRPRR